MKIATKLESPPKRFSPVQRVHDLIYSRRGHIGVNKFTFLHFACAKSFCYKRIVRVDLGKQQEHIIDIYSSIGEGAERQQLLRILSLAGELFGLQRSVIFSEASSP